MNSIIKRDPLVLYPLSENITTAIAKHLPVPRRCKVSTHIIINAIVYVLYHCTSWRLLEGRYEYTDENGTSHPVHWGTIYQRYRRWVMDDRIGAMFNHYRDLVYNGTDLSQVSIDSTCFKAHAGVGDTTSMTISLTKGGRNTKLHIITGNDYYPLNMSITSGSVNDHKAGLALLRSTDLQRVRALAGDKAYSTYKTIILLNQHEVTPVILPKRNMRVQWQVDKKAYAQRSIIECYFNQLKRNRHLTSRFDRSLIMFTAFIQLHSIIEYFLHEDHSPCGRWKKV